MVFSASATFQALFSSDQISYKFSKNLNKFPINPWLWERPKFKIGCNEKGGAGGLWGAEKKGGGEGLRATVHYSSCFLAFFAIAI